VTANFLTETECPFCGDVVDVLREDCGVQTAHCDRCREIVCVEVPMRVLDNVPEEHREMVRYALELAAADTSGANDRTRDDDHA
jgi:hypothetical protein